MSTFNEKKALRQALLASRCRSAGGDYTKENSRITSTVLKLLVAKNCTSVFVYVSAHGEVDTHGIINALHDEGIAVLVPRIISKDQMVAIAFPGWKNMSPGPLGILSPSNARPWTSAIDAAVIPGLGFSMRGERIGHGAGYYDRWLSNNNVWKIAVCFDYQMCERLPTTATDVLMDVVVTQSGSTAIGGQQPDGGDS
ncbi:MAG: 5-formyltetrahydrofolate cyclo-ligase [Proteobacteria bacterium]|nr:5-formyltetrahydrofolate cyclo-ligase [Pseudomonadota bacterium]